MALKHHVPPVVNDLLYALMGLDGKYVQARLVPGTAGGGRALTFVVAGHFDPSLQDLVSRVLPFWCVPGLGWCPEIQSPSNRDVHLGLRQRVLPLVTVGCALSEALHPGTTRSDHRDCSRSRQAYVLRHAGGKRRGLLAAACLGFCGWPGA